MIRNKKLQESNSIIKFTNNLGQIEMSLLVKWVIIILLLLAVVVLWMVLGDKGDGLLSGLLNIF